MNIVDYLNLNKEWIFSGIGILAITSLWSIIRKSLIKDNGKNSSVINNINSNNINSNNINSNNVNFVVKNRGKPNLMIKTECREWNLFYLDYYSTINSSYKNILNYGRVHMPQLVDELEINILNLGDDFAKDIEVSFFLDREECLLTDKNISWLFISLSLENLRKKNVEELLVHSYKIHIIESHESIRLPLNQTLNGIIISCLFNLVHFISFEKDEFSRMKSEYESVENGELRHAPKLHVLIKYRDGDGAVREVKYEILFELKFIQAGSHLRIEYQHKVYV